jgi:hypothetical protein
MVQFGHGQERRGTVSSPAVSTDTKRFGRLGHGDQDFEHSSPFPSAKKKAG